MIYMELNSNMPSKISWGNFSPFWKYVCAVILCRRGQISLSTCQVKFLPDGDNCRQNNGQEMNAVIFRPKSKLWFTRWIIGTGRVNSDGLSVKHATLHSLDSAFRKQSSLFGCVYRRDSPSNRRFKSPISLPVTLDKRDGDLITCLAYRTRVPQNSGIWLPLSQMRDSSSGDKHNMIWFAYVCMNSRVRFVRRIEATGLSWFRVPSINTARMRSCICEQDRIADSVRDSSTHF